MPLSQLTGVVGSQLSMPGVLVPGALPVTGAGGGDLLAPDPLSLTLEFGQVRMRRVGDGVTVLLGTSQLASIADLSVSEQANQRNTASFRLPGLQKDQRPIVGTDVKAYFDGVLIFAGSIDAVEEMRYAGDSEMRLEYNVSCVDYNQICDRLLVAESFANISVRDAALALILNYLAAEGVTAGTIDVGPTLERVVFPYMPVADCLNDLCNLSGFTWNIDYEKRLNLRAPEEDTAPVTISEPVNMARQLRVKRDRNQYRNVQAFVGGRDVSEPESEEFVPDGVQRTWTVGLPIAESPEITLIEPGPSLSPQSVGVKGLDVGKQFYWNRDDATITLDAAYSPAPSSPTRIRVDYRGFFPIFLKQEDPGQIAARASVEGGTGRYEQVERDESIESSALGSEKALGFLRRFGQVPTVVDLVADTAHVPDLTQCHAGQSMSVDLPSHGIVADTFLIQSMNIRLLKGRKPGQARMGTLEYSFSLVDGERRENMAEFMQKLIQRGRRTTLRENEVFTISRTFSDALSPPGDSPVSPTTASPRLTSLVGIAQTGFSEAL